MCTSGSPGPTVGKNIGLGYLPTAMSAVGATFSVDCRGKNIDAVVVPTPFYKRGKHAMSDQVPPELRYTKEHEWVRESGGEIAVGITAFAVEQLGDVTLVNLDVKVGDEVGAGKPFGTIESVKTLSDLYAPVAGKVVRINEELATSRSS